ncbi:MAG: hypothetical protein K6C94_04260 [Candidatus Gastranaerophilales bacterium]|nr:hypothetical protein [Candidatus Gastranaerophilales bacterium]
MINFKEIIIYVVTILLLTTVYYACFNYAEKGYGYTGYRGFHHHRSFWYYRNTNEAFSPSNRESSQSGNNFSRRGLSGGK